MAEICRGDPADTRCGAFVNGVGGLTVAQCSGYTGDSHADGDPYQAGCEDKVFNDQKAARATTCGEGANASDDMLCGNAVRMDACIGDPYGKVTGTAPDRADCAPETYMIARMARDTYCRNSAPAGETLCSAEAKNKICGGAEGNNPFATLCSKDGDNISHRMTFCGLTETVDSNTNSDCINDRVSLCTGNPFGTDLGVLRNVDCTDGYESARQNRCATGRENGNDCDTGEIAPTVCAESTGENANPFAAFCDDATNDGQDADMLLATRQTVLTHCLDSNNSADPVCVKSNDVINGTDGMNGLETDCRVVGSETVTRRCAYTQYRTVQEMYCTKIENNIFDTNCKDVTHGDVKIARQNECRLTTGTPTVIDREAKCLDVIADLCVVSAFELDSEKGYLCGADVKGINYATARETQCGISGTGEGALIEQCKATIAGICIDAKLIETQVGLGLYDCSTSTDTAVMSARQDYCADNSNEMKSGCADTLATLCMGEASLTRVANGYNCADSTVAGVVTARETLCQMRDNTDGACNNTIANYCAPGGTDLTTSDIFNLLCREGYDIARKAFCTENPENVAGDCNDYKVDICDGAETTDNPYAPICDGDNLAAKKKFCGLGGNSGARMCSDTIMTTCDATLGNPFDPLCSDNDADKQAACRPPDGMPPPGEDCMDTIKKFCGETTDAATEKTFDDRLCEGMAYDTARETACKIFEGDLLTKCTGTITSLCMENPFTQTTGTTEGNLCVDESGSTMHASAREAACRPDGTLPPDADCTDTIRNFCGDPNGDADINKVFGDALCTQGVIYTPARIKSCSAKNPVGDILTLCRDSGLLDMICNGGTTDADWNPYADICAEPTATANISGGSFDLAIAQSSFKVFCGGNKGDSRCRPVIVEVCSSASDADLFSTLCDTGYTDARVAACEATKDRTGVYSDCDTVVLATHCPENDIRNPACAPLAGATTLPASLWVAAARNADNSGTLNVLDAVGLDDAYTNYVQGTATGLQLGAILEGDGGRKTGATGDETVLKITDLDNLNAGDVAGGVAFVRIEFADFTSANKVKYYAGLLSDTDLGAPFGAPLGGSTANAIWNASFAAIVNGVVETDTETSVVIDFDINSLTTNDNEPVTLSNSAGSIVIAGKFTDAGVIYGTSSWTVGGDSRAGSVTGLIGAKGAVGAFVYSGENTDDVYAGGFVAAPVTDAICHDATTELPFHRLCNASDPDVMMARTTICTTDKGNSFAPRCAPYVMTEQKTNFADTCRTSPQTTGCDTVLGEATTLTVNDCTSTATGHPHHADCADAGFTAQRVLRISDCRDYVKGTPPQNLLCEQTRVDMIITDCRANPFNPICTPYAEEYATAQMQRIEDCGLVTRETIDGKVCNDPLILDEVCAPTGKPVSYLCDGYNTGGVIIADVRKTFCGTNIDNRCDGTVQQICLNDVFNDLCDNDNEYAKERRSMCEEIVFSTENFTNGTRVANNCLNKLYIGCDADPFEVQCFIGNLYETGTIGELCRSQYDIRGKRRCLQRHKWRNQYRCGLLSWARASERYLRALHR